jgi:hypothetical protein
MKIPGLLLSFILTQTCFAQFKLRKLDKSSIPMTIHYMGKVVQAVRWTDKTGDNIVILTATGKTQSKHAPDVVILTELCMLITILFSVTALTRHGKFMIM